VEVDTEKLMAKQEERCTSTVRNRIAFRCADAEFPSLHGSSLFFSAGVRKENEIKKKRDLFLSRIPAGIIHHKRARILLLFIQRRSKKTYDIPGPFFRLCSPCGISQ